MKGRTVCYHHGGKSPRGAAAARFKTGRWSKYVHTSLAADYMAGRDDPDLLQLRDDIAMVDARIGQLLAGVGEAGRPEDWERLKKLLDAYLEAGRMKNAAKAGALLVDLQEVIGAGASEAEAWRDIFTLFEQRRRLVETERRTMIDLQQMMTAQQGLTMIGVLEAILREHIRDQPTLTAIASDIDRYFNAEPERESEHGGRR